MSHWQPINFTGLGRDADAPGVEGHHGDLETLAFLAEHVLFGDAAVLEDQIRSRGRPDAQLVFLRPERKTLRISWDNEGAKPLLHVARACAMPLAVGPERL